MPSQGDNAEDRVASRASKLLPEEETAGVDDPRRQAEAILTESDSRQQDRSAAPDAAVETRQSADTV